MLQQVAITVSDASQVGEARRTAAIVADRAGLDDTQAGCVAIIVTEIAHNLVRYADDGLILLRADDAADGDPNDGMMEILSIDRGPGFDVGRCMADGFSTGGTPGNGLGAVRRLAAVFDVYSQPSGTVIMARVRKRQQRAARAPTFQWSCISRPAPGEIECGDTWCFTQSNGNAAFVVADGLGHGPAAAAAAGHAASVFRKDPFAEATHYIESTHLAMNGTRGAAVAIACVDTKKLTLRYAGVGNIAGTLVSPTARQGLPSHNGIVGTNLPRVRAFDYLLPTSGVLIMHSDGLQSRWNLDIYPGLAMRHPSLIAAVLYRDFYRGRDDVSILVGSWQGGAA